jgi:hypothetical protein
MTHKYILSCDGGGIKGIITLIILDKIEKETGKKIYDIFDFFAGTSMGSLIVTLLVYKRYSPQEIIEKYYTNDFLSIFFDAPGDKLLYNLSTRRTSIMNNFFNRTALFFRVLKMKSRYGINKKDMFSSELLNMKLQDNTEKKILIPIFDCNKNKPIYVTNYNTKNYFLRDICYAAITMPGFLPIDTHDTKNNKCDTSEENLTDIVGLDGGMFRNNPSDLAYGNALQLWGPSTILHILSIGTGYYLFSGVDNCSATWGPIKWMTKGHIIEKMIRGNSMSTSYITSTVAKSLGHTFLRVDVPIDDYRYANGFTYYKNTLEKLRNYAEIFWETEKDKILNFINAKNL